MTKKNNPATDKNEKAEVDQQASASNVETDAARETGEEVAESAHADAGQPDAGEAESSLEEQLASAKEESRVNHERYLRTVADWENYRRRMTREKEELRKHSISALLEEFLPVLDNLTLGLQTAANHPEAANVAQGFQMVADQIRGILDRYGISEIHPEGEAFDPHHHESLSHQPHDEIPEGNVVQVVRKGYSLDGRLLRPASVVVSSGPAATDES